MWLRPAITCRFESVLESFSLDCHSLRFLKLEALKVLIQTLQSLSLTSFVDNSVWKCIVLESFSLDYDSFKFLRFRLFRFSY